MLYEVITTKNGKWYYGYSKIQLTFKVNWKRKLFNSVYTLNSEMAITDWKKIEGETISGRITSYNVCYTKLLRVVFEATQQFLQQKTVVSNLDAHQQYELKNFLIIVFHLLNDKLLDEIELRMFLLLQF